MARRRDGARDMTTGVALLVPGVFDDPRAGSSRLPRNHCGLTIGGIFIFPFFRCKCCVDFHSNVATFGQTTRRCNRRLN